MSWAEERRATKAAEAEQARLDADAASARRIRERESLAAQNRKDEQTRTEQALKATTDRRAARAAALGKLRTWAAAHVIDLLIYPLALASAVMAIPSMGAYGTGLYGNATGGVLPVLTELGMWAFAVAVTVSRKLHPDRPVWALQLGILVFAASGFAINLLHGLNSGLSAGVVMGFASIAGVIAHQLVTASPRRSAIERAEQKITRRAVRKTAKIRAAAVRAAVAEIDVHGNAALVFAPGTYTLGRRGKLTAATVPGLPVAPPADLSDVIGDQVSAWLAEQDRPSIDGPARGPVATLDPPSDQHKSTPKRPVREPKRKTLDQYRAELLKALATDPASIDTTSAESIRKALRCSPQRARQLRDEYRAAE